jgi:hypothetical protein
MSDKLTRKMIEEDVRSFLDNFKSSLKRGQQTSATSQASPSGEKAKPSPEKKKKKKGSSLKRIPGPELQKTLNQLRNKGISGEKIGALFDKAADEISKGAAAAPSIRRDFEQKDRPLINMMRDQVVAILNGNFASLKEGKIHNGTIAFFKEIIK